MTYCAIKVVRENIVIVVIVFIYMTIGYFIQYFYKIPEMMKLRLTYLILIQISIIFSACFLIAQILSKKTWEYVNIQSFSGFWIIVLLLVPFKCTFASIKQVIPLINNFTWDTTFMQIDYVLHFNHHPWMFFKAILDNEFILRQIDFFYTLWFFILLMFCLGIAWTSNRRLRFQFFVSSLLVWMILGSLFGTIFSSAGPCYYSNVIDISQSADPYQPMMVKLFSYHETKTLWAVHNQIGLWEAKIENSWLPFGGISAMPSIHVAMAILFVFAGWQINKLLGIVMTIFALVIQIGSIVLGWHYAIDGYFSIISTGLIWHIVGKFYKPQNYFNLNKLNSKAGS